MKKIFLIALLLMAVLNIHAADFNKDGFYYNILSLSDLTVELAAPDNGYYSGDITVPRTVEYMSRTFDVVSIDEKAFEDCNINTLSIMDNIKKLGALYIGQVKNLRFEDSDEPLTIDAHEWHWKNYREEVNNNVVRTYLNNMSVYIGRDINYYHDSDFIDDYYYFSGDEHDDDFFYQEYNYGPFHNDYAFYSGAKSVEFGPKVTTISRFLFNQCNTLTNVTIPDNVKSIGDDAFAGTAIKNIKTNANYIGAGAFTGTPMTSVEALRATSIGGGVFGGCSKLKQVEFSDALTSIGGSAFYNCTALEDFIIPDKLKEIGGSAFAGCTSLKSFVIPEGVCYIGFSAFSGCTNLESVKIPNSVYDFGNIYVTYSNGNVFKGCSALKTIILGHRIPMKMWENSFDLSTYLSATLKVPSGTKEKYQSADYWKNFFNIEEDATINDDICTVAINRSNYYGGTVTVEVTGSLGEWYNYESKQDLIVSPRGEKIKISAKAGENYRLTSLTVNGEDVTESVVRNVYVMELTDNMELTITPTFEYYRYQTVVTSEATFKEQDDGGFAITAFADNVTKYAIPETVVDQNETSHTVNSIENSTFEGNTNITSVSIPASITYIADRAFAGCTSLEEIYVYSEKPIDLAALSQNSIKISFGADATDSSTSGLPVFEGVNKETCILYVPKGCVEKYRSASGWNEFANITEFDVTAVEKIKNNMYNNKVVSKFSVDGKQLPQPQKGMNILKMSDGTTKKIVK